MKNKNTVTHAQANLLEQATYYNGYSPLISNSKSIGFKINAIKFQDSNSTTNVAEDFIANLGFCKNDLESEHSIMSFLMPAGTVMLSFTNQEDNHHLEKINLPKSLPLKMGLECIIKTRRSIRHYTGDEVPLSYLATILRSSYGITASTEIDLQNDITTTLSTRSSASAGGIYPIDIYIASINVGGLEKGIYQYNPTDDALVKLYGSDTVDKLLTTFSTNEEQISLKRSGFICLLVGTASKSMQKYGNLGLSFTIHETGSISQNIHLTVTALGLGSVDCASYYRSDAHQALKMDGIYKHLFHTIVIGVRQ